MTSHTQILVIVLILGSQGILNCGKNREAAYTVTTYYTTFDSSNTMAEKKGKRIKFEYEEYNGDSNLIYVESYSTDLARWGRLTGKARMVYKGKLKVQEEKEEGINLERSQPGKRQDIYTFAYEGEKLSKKYHNGKLTEEYTYDSEGNLSKMESVG